MRWGRLDAVDAENREILILEREGVRHFSLESWEIRPSAVVGIRRETALRREGFAWVPDLRSFDKLREVGVSPYLGFILRLSTL